jgi:hypothetical protein
MEVCWRSIVLIPNGRVGRDVYVVSEEIRAGHRGK